MLYITNNSMINDKTVLFQIIQFCIRDLFVLILNVTSIEPIDRTLSGVTALVQSGSGSDGNEGLLHIPQSSSITEASPSDSLMSYQDTHWGRLTPMQRSSWCILQPQPNGLTERMESQTREKLQTNIHTAKKNMDRQLGHKRKSKNRQTDIMERRIK